MSVESVKEEREMREKRAKERAMTLPPGDYHASDEFVVNTKTYEAVMECESHWDACLVLIAIPR